MSLRSHIDVGRFQVMREAGGTLIRLEPHDAAGPPSPAPASMADRPHNALFRAHQLQELLDSGEVRNRAALAAKLGISRARITQILSRLVGGVA